MIFDLRRVGYGFLLLLLTAGAAQGQGWFRGRVGLQMKASSVEKSIAPGIHVDAQAQIAGRFALVAGAGLSAYVLEGRRSGTYTVDPALSLRIARPSRSRGANILSGGVGYHFPFGDRALGRGPTVHLGIGRIWALRESTLFVDLRPTTVLRDGGVSVLMPIRAGVVF
ncbi:MAG: hypothetical protein ABEL51_12390 [Salinibacter sp.]